MHAHPKDDAAGRPSVRRALEKLLALRPGESAPVGAALVTLGGLIAGHTILETARDALFLARLPVSRLALVYIVVAATTLLTSSLNARSVRRIGRERALDRMVLAASVGTAVYYFVPKTPAALYALHAWSAWIGASLVPQFWMLADRMFTVAQGKRLFAVIGAGGIAGAMVGGGVASLLLAVVPVSGLLLVSSAMFLATAAYLRIQRRGADGAPSEVSSRAHDAGEDVLASTRHRAHVRRLALLVASSTAALLVADYLFKTIAAQRIPAAELGAFLARAAAGFNALSLAVQLVLTGPILRRLGVIPAVAMLPFFLAVGGLGHLVTGGSLTMALLARGAESAFRYSTHRAGSEVLWMPLPREARERARAFLDAFGARAVQAAVAVLLLVLDALGAASPRVLASLALVLAVAWLLVDVALRRSYLELLRAALAKGALDPRALPIELDAASVQAVLLHALRLASEREPRDWSAPRDRIEEELRKALVEHLIGTALLVQLERGPDRELDRRASHTRSLLVEVVAHKQGERLDRAFRLLQLLYPRDDLRSVHRAIRIGDAGLRAHATEYLQTFSLGRTLPHRETRQLARLVLDDLLPRERVARARARGLVPAPPVDYEEAVLSLLRDQDALVAVLGAHHASDLGAPRLLAEVERLGLERRYADPPSSPKRSPASGARTAVEEPHGA